MRQSAVRAFNPIIGVLLAKKVVFYRAAELYGFPRLYRRLAEGVRTHVPSSQQQGVRTALKKSFRFPKQAATLLSDSRGIKFLQHFGEDVLASNNMPPFMRSLAKLIVANSPFSTVLNWIHKLRSKKTE
jgi:hypothetical protein